MKISTVQRHMHLLKVQAKIRLIYQSKNQVRVPLGVQHFMDIRGKLLV